MKSPITLKIRGFLATAALISVLILSILAGSNRHNETMKFWDPEKIGKDAISLWDHRFDRMAGYLPQHGTIGYINDKAVEGRKVNSLDESGEYILSRYALAPLVLLRDPDQKLVLGNFSFNDSTPPFDSMGYTVIKQFDYELYLLQPGPK